ncbi:small acid-soluble spore protein H [Halalkalibacter akibai]|uniref:Small, acid-soluble spore protein H n=1 Tax=Halalkalibacter akibai (strain ATCC 43226 / DSM 21942 / CIP 109018 / JCM 9157 / 1139) TaxID=1236973 RepID=W4QNH4_HALA3|nr:small acid-soluble spore protein H [Halalkalibacter akibai]GAE33665.1 acid-soluble spore protein H [Halalkalibacter akibai JCM 9157]
MDTQRAHEISSSPAMVDVLYNGERIYIEHVDQGNGMATIHPLDDPGDKYSVTVDSLTEKPSR